jgi:uncharacterized glyoxalase superfamily protein PhnB
MIAPHLTFNGSCKNALDFYRAVTDRFNVNWNVVAEEAPEKAFTEAPPERPSKP